MSNPFNELYEIMGSATTIVPSFFIAVVSSPLPNLKIKFEGIELDKEDFVVGKWLLDRHYDLGFVCDFNNCANGIVGTVEHEGTKSIKCVNYNGCSKICKKKTDKEFKCIDCTVPCKTECNFDDRLVNDDKVLLAKVGELFVIIDKVVKL